MGVEVASIGWITMGMGFCSAPARTFIAEGAEFAEDFLALDLDAAPLDAPSPDASCKIAGLFA
jgi:hypothetical protein